MTNRFIQTMTQRLICCKELNTKEDEKKPPRKKKTKLKQDECMKTTTTRISGEETIFGHIKCVVVLAIMSIQI